MIGLPLVLVMLEIEPPTMVPGYPLKLTPKTPVRPVPLMVMTDPGRRSRRASDIGGHGGAAEDREGERVRGVVGRRRPRRRSLESDESRAPGPGAGVGGDHGAVPAAVLQVEGSGVLDVFALTFVTIHRLLMAESLTPLITTRSPTARVPVSAVVIVIVPPEGLAMLAIGATT